MISQREAWQKLSPTKAVIELRHSILTDKDEAIGRYVIMQFKRHEYDG
jgi:hypothetical protein